MLLISGAADQRTLGMGCFQDLDQAALARPITKFSRVIDTPARAVQILDQAWHQACSPEPGPVHLMFPMDVQRAEVEATGVVRANDFPAQAGPSRNLVAQAAQALRECSRPLIITGSPVYYAGEGADLIRFAEAFSIPVQTGVWERGIFDAPSDVFLGVAGAFSGGPDLPGQCDCLILAGMPADYRLNYLQETQARVCSLDRGWGELDHGGGSFQDWLREAAELRDTHRRGIEEAAAKQRQPSRMHAIDLMRALEASLPTNATLVIDAGSVGQWAHQLLATHRYPSYWLTCGRGGVVGYGIPGAMAARLAFPDRPVVLLSGDGAFTFTPAELECAVRQKLHFTAIVADDQCWGITHSGHMRQFGQSIATQLGPIRFDLLAQSLGARGFRIDNPSRLPAAIADGIDSNQVTVLHVPISGGNPV